MIRLSGIATRSLMHPEPRVRPDARSEAGVRNPHAGTPCRACAARQIEPSMSGRNQGSLLLHPRNAPASSGQPPFMEGWASLVPYRGHRRIHTATAAPKMLGSPAGYPTTFANPDSRRSGSHELKNSPRPGRSCAPSACVPWRPGSTAASRGAVTVQRRTRSRHGQTDADRTRSAGRALPSRRDTRPAARAR